MRSQEVFEQMVREWLRQAVCVALIDILEEEVSTFIGVRPSERSKERRDQRNGHYLRNLETTVGLVAGRSRERVEGTRPRFLSAIIVGERNGIVRWARCL
jgi:hypothetical protein